MLHLIKNVFRSPEMPFEAVSWLFQKYVLSRMPVRHHFGVAISNFVDFSEFHSFPTTVSKAENHFLKFHDFGEGTFVDVGANLGLFSMVVASHHPGRRIVAFEPGGTTFPALQANLKRNGANVESHNMAIAAHDGEVCFAMKEKARANSSITNDGEGYAVPARRLDTIVEDLGIDKIALLKIDTEGFEAIVLRGAEKTLAEIRPSTIYFEVCPELSRRAGFAAGEPAQILHDASYDLFAFSEDGALSPVTPENSNDRPLANWVAKPRAVG